MLPSPRLATAPMADVFISYSKSHLKLTRNLAEELEAKGLTVWWDTDLIAGESFRDRIVQEIKTCKAAIVIWTSDSVHSDYVVSEAERARVAGKLIQLRTADVEQIVALVQAGRANAQTERIFAGVHMIEVARMRITDAGRRALQA